ncbi:MULTISPECIES: group II intron maturase-specific domain-containing protein [Legionella]|uniref:group II intron maturase-specific domain-containing protein n=1 Tax=Legionella TaxID=445 RepID=UPI0010414A24
MFYLSLWGAITGTIGTINPILQGWLNYYGQYTRSAMYPVCRHFNKTLVAWAMRKYKKLCGRKIKASKFNKDK